MRRYFCSLITVTCLLVALSTHAYEKDHLVYEIISEEDATVSVRANTEQFNETSLVIPDKIEIDGKTYTVIAINANAFDSDFDMRKPIRSIKFPPTIKKIGPYAFRYCQTRTLQLPEGLEKIGDGAFTHNYELSSISFPQSLKEIGEESFRDIYEVSRIHLPREMKSIGMAAFLGVTIPSRVRSIAEGAFLDVPNLQYVRVKCAEPPAIHRDAFDRYDLTLYVPTGCKSAYQSAAYWSKFTDIREVADAETVPPDYPDNRCRLTIRDSERGATILYVERGSTPMVELTPAGGKTVSQLLFNNQDVTQMLHTNNRFHTPAVTEDSTLEILYK